MVVCMAAQILWYKLYYIESTIGLAPWYISRVSAEDYDPQVLPGPLPCIPPSWTIMQMDAVSSFSRHPEAICLDQAGTRRIHLPIYLGHLCGSCNLSNPGCCSAYGSCLQVTVEDAKVRDEAAKVADEQTRVYKAEYLKPTRQGNCSVGVIPGNEWKTVVSLLHMNIIKLVRPTQSCEPLMRTLASYTLCGRAA